MSSTRHGQWKPGAVMGSCRLDPVAATHKGVPTSTVLHRPPTQNATTRAHPIYHHRPTPTSLTSKLISSTPGSINPPSSTSRKCLRLSSRSAVSADRQPWAAAPLKSGQEAGSEGSASSGGIPHRSRLVSEGGRCLRRVGVAGWGSRRGPGAGQVSGFGSPP